MEHVLTIDNGVRRIERRFETASEMKVMENHLRTVMPNAQFLQGTRPATWHTDKKFKR